MSPKSVLKSSACVLALCILGAGTAYAKGPEIPTEKVIQTYSPPIIAAADLTQSASSGPGTPNDPNDIRRYETTSRTYSGTIRMLESMIQEIRKASPDTSLNPKIRVYNQQMVEAKALGDNLIVVSTGLIKALTDAQVPTDTKEKDLKNFEISKADKVHGLAFILAHEYAHLLYKHPALYPREKENTKIFTKAVAGGLQLMRTTQTLHAQFGGGMSQEFHEANKILYGAAVASPWIEAELYRFAYAPYQKEAEQTADYMAADLLSNSVFGKPKYNAEKGAQPLRAFYESYDDSTNAKLKRLGKEAANTAKDASLQMAATAPAVALGGGDVGAHMKSHLKLAAISFGVKKLIGRLNTKKVHLYYSSDKRVDAIEDYFTNFYVSEVDDSTPAMEAFFDTLSDTFSNENSASAAAEQAMEFLAKGDIEGAVKALKNVTSSKRFQDTQYLTASGNVAFAQGNFAQAISHYNQAKRKGDVTIQVFRDLSRSHMMTNNSGMAVNAMDEGMAKFGVETFIVEKIALLVTLDKPEDVKAAYDECLKLTDKDVLKGCEKAAKPVLDPGSGKGFLGDLGDAVKDTTGL
ncbi:MAG: M48 family metalloprotease [Alphaproteobacteria bacterium]